MASSPAMTPSAQAPRQTLLWHDYETFGKSPRADRPAQFAAVRTDLELNEIGEPLLFYCRPGNDYLPDPEACLLTGITPQLCLERGLPEHEFAARIERALAEPGTIGVGYNSIRFDDEVTRYLFWRNLIDPYAREYRHGCARWDILDLMRCAHALRPEGMVWPQRADGSGTSFRLADLAAANGVVHEAAHDALSDARATLALARRLRSCNQRLYDFCFALRDKKHVATELGLPTTLPDAKPFLHVSRMFGAEHGHLAACFPLAMHPTNRNELIAWDLAQDPSELGELDAQTVQRRLFTRADQMPGGERRLAIKSIHLNKSPVVIGNCRTLRPEQAARWGIDWDRIERHTQAARGLPDLRALWSHVFEREREPAPDVEQDLYSGFLDDADRRRLEHLRAQSPERLAAARSGGFDDPRLEELCWRWRARNFPQTLSAEEAERWQQHCAARLLEGAGGARTLDAYFAEIDTLASNADERGEEILGALYDWAEAIAPES